MWKGTYRFRCPVLSKALFKKSTLLYRESRLLRVEQPFSSTSLSTLNQTRPLSNSSPSPSPHFGFIPGFLVLESTVLLLDSDTLIAPTNSLLKHDAKNLLASNLHDTTIGWIKTFASPVDHYYDWKLWLKLQTYQSTIIDCPVPVPRKRN